MQSIRDIHARVKYPQNVFYRHSSCKQGGKMAKLTSETTDKLVGQRIQKRRKELGMTALQLAEYADISQQQLSRYERGTNKSMLPI